METAHTVDLVARGGFGYLLKDRVLDVADFLAAVDRVARGGSALDPYVVGQLLHRTDGRQGLTDLTEREHEVLRMMAQGFYALLNSSSTSSLTTAGVGPPVQPKSI